jgi:hypothetical protein
VIFVALVGLVLLRKARRELAIVVTVATLVAGPWLLTCLLHDGRPWPESGAAVLAIADRIDSVGRALLSLSFAAGWFAPGTVMDRSELRALFVQHPALGSAAAVLVIVGIVLATRRAPIAVPVWVFASLLLIPLYALAVPAIWGFHRYLLPARVAVTLALGVVLARVGQRYVTRTLAIVASLEVACLFVDLSARLSGATRGSLVAGAVTGYRESALAMFAALPEGATVGALQSGALGYFRPAGVRVVNLDGVVSREARHAYVDRRIDERLRAQGVTHLADWPSYLRAIVQRSAPGAVELRVIAHGPPQGPSLHFVLAELARR